MKTSNRFLAAAIAAMAMAFAVSTASAQIIGPGGPFPQCNSNTLTIVNHSGFDIVLGVKYVGIFFVGANSSLGVPIVPGQQVPGVAGIANTTYPWAANPAGVPPLWVPSLALKPSANCFDVFFDPATCTIDVYQAAGPPCTNP